MIWKIAWIAAAALVGGLGLLLWRVLPACAWAEWDGRKWQLVASGWPVLWRAWPAVLAGGLAGFLGAGGLLGWAAKVARDAAVKAEAGRLQRKWDSALAEVENRARGREEDAGRRESEALKAQQAANLARHEAEAAKRRAEQACLDAEAVQQDAQRRIRNAVGAAERIKRKANISALAGGPKPARNSPPEPPR